LYFIIVGDDKKESHESNISTLTKQRHDSDSSPRGQRHDYDFGQSPLRRKRHDSDSDQSLPRRKRHDSDSDQSLPRRKRHDSDSDQSLPRRKRHDSDSDQSPPRRKRCDSDSDQSPPRRKRRDSDQSPPRRKRQDSDSDQSPPRRKRRDSDQSPPRRKRHEYDSDQSPPRRKKSKKHESRESLSNIKKKSRWEVEEDKYTEEEKRAVALEAIKDARGRAAKTLGGATAGLSSAAQMKHEAKIMRQREDEMFRKVCWVVYSYHLLSLLFSMLTQKCFNSWINCFDVRSCPVTVQRSSQMKNSSIYLFLIGCLYVASSLIVILTPKVEVQWPSY